MTHFTSSLPTGSSKFDTFKSFATGIATLVKRIWRVTGKRVTNYNQARNLLALDDHMLSDLGLTRGDIYASLATAGRIPPMVRLTLLAVERRATARALASERLGRNRRKPGRAAHYEDA